MKSSNLFDDHNDLLLLFYKICSPLCLIINGLAVYVIIFKSSSEMKTYRWHLLHYQIWAFALDIFLNFLYQPVQFFPLMAEAGHGFLITNLGLSTFTCHCILGNLMCGFFASIVELFLYRHQCIVRNKLNRKQFFFCILFYFFVVAMSINIFNALSYVDPSQWSEMLEKWDPRALELLKIPNIYYVPPSRNGWIVKIIAFVSNVFTVVTISALVGHIFYVLQKQSEHLSLRTRQMQRKFFISLMWQVAVPFVFLFIPLIFTCIRSFDGRLGLQILNNIATMIVSSSGILATLCVLYFNHPYRKFLFGKLKRKEITPITLVNLSESRKT